MATFKEIVNRIEDKKSDYQRYEFSQVEHVAIMTFFDLAQEYDNLDDFYTLCVAILKSFFNLDACLYLAGNNLDMTGPVAQTDEKKHETLDSFHDERRLHEGYYFTKEKNLVLPIRGKDNTSIQERDNILGALVIYPIDSMSQMNTLFFEKYVNRIGFNMHNKFIAGKNIEHLKFIRSLVADIEHNVIVPNMIYRLFLRRLRGKIVKNKEIEAILSRHFHEGQDTRSNVAEILKELKEVNSGLSEELEHIEKHYKNMSLFLETLFRKDHFDKGRLTLRMKACNMKKDVVQPQLERYIEQFRKAGIEIADRFSGIPDEEIISVVDVGLMAQVYANFFSNALKYTQEIAADTGEKKKYIAYGRELCRDCFGPGKDGIKYNVFSTGTHVRFEEQKNIFEEGYRASNSSGKPGTGHGLTFIKNAVELHGGIIGYEATQYGNNFYFILQRTP